VLDEIKPNAARNQALLNGLGSMPSYKTTLTGSPDRAALAGHVARLLALRRGEPTRLLHLTVDPGLAACDVLTSNARYFRPAEPVVAKRFQRIDTSEVARLDHIGTTS
jgi:hypothetical protein